MSAVSAYPAKTQRSYTSLLKVGTSLSWLATGDKLAPVVAAGTGALSFAWTVFTSRQQRALPRAKSAVEKMRQMPHFNLALTSGCVALSLSVLQFINIFPEPSSIVLSLSTILCGSAALILFLMGQITAIRDSPMPLPVAIRSILEIEKRSSESHRYSFGSMHIPSVSKLYVARRGQNWDWPETREAPAKVVTETTAIEATLHRYRHSVIVAGPGGGKSTIAAWVVGQSARWWLNAIRKDKASRAPYGPAIAIYLHASDFVSEGIEESIASKYLKRGISQISSDDFRKPPLPNVDWLVFVDGVDELSETNRRSVVLNTLTGYLSDHSSPIRIVVTTRPLPIGEIAELRSPDVSQVHLRPFDRDDIREFARKWFFARAEYPARPEETEDTVDRFFNNIRTACLVGMMRVPLLVAMAALVFERNATNKLPATRSDLYREYISLLLSARAQDSIPDARSGTIRPLPDPSSFSAWLRSVMPNLLLALAIARVKDPGCSLMLVSRDWIRQQLSTDQLTEPEWPWIGALHSTLIATSVLEAVGSEIEFLHQSIAEYLSADQHAREVGSKGLIAELADPARRSLALFSLARGGLDISKMVDNLIQNGDALSAGYVLAEGFTLDDALQQSIVTGLLEYISNEDTSAIESIVLLTDLAVHESVCNRLIRIVEDNTEAPWTRALIADSLSELYPDLGMRMLRTVATDRRSGHDASRIWATQRLQARGDEFAGRIRREISLENSRDLSREGRLAEHAARKIALDPRTPPKIRIDIAGRLANNNDSLEALRQIAAWEADVDNNERVAAAQLLLERGDAIGRTILEEITKDRSIDESTRRMAALSLSREDNNAELRVLLERAQDRGLDPWRRRMSAEALVRRDDPAGLRILRVLVDDNRVDSYERYAVAQSLARHGDKVGIDYLGVMSQNSRGEYHERYSVATALARSNSREGEDALAKLASDAATDPWERRMAAQRLFSMSRTQVSIDALVSIAAESSIAPDERYEAACVLFDSEISEGADVLQQLALDTNHSFRVRYYSALTLLEKGHQIGFEVMRNLAEDTSCVSDDRFLAARVLADYRDDVGLIALRNLARNSSEDIHERRQAAHALAKLGDAEGIQVLQELSDN